jgi:hypothetical protein
MNIKTRFYVTLSGFLMIILANADAMIHDPRAIDADPATATSPIMNFP